MSEPVKDVADHFDGCCADIRSALDAILDKADELSPLFAALASALAGAKVGVKASLRAEARIGQGLLNSVQAVHMRHRGLEASMVAFEQGLEGLYDHRRVLSEMHPALVAALGGVPAEVSR